MAKEKIAVKTQMEEAQQLEKEGRHADALKIYRASTRRRHLNAEAYSRMMVILRKQKQYKTELDVIQRAIAAAEKAIAANQRVVGDRDPGSADLAANWPSHWAYWMTRAFRFTNRPSWQLGENAKPW